MQNDWQKTYKLYCKNCQKQLKFVEKIKKITYKTCATNDGKLRPYQKMDENSNNNYSSYYLCPECHFSSTYMDDFLIESDSDCSHPKLSIWNDPDDPEITLEICEDCDMLVDISVSSVTPYNLYD